MSLDNTKRIVSVKYNGQGWLDLTGDTVTAAHLESGYTAHDKSGAKVTGTLVPGITPSGTKTITANGTHDVKNYANANVNVPFSENLPSGYTKLNYVGVSQSETSNKYAYIDTGIQVKTRMKYSQILKIDGNGDGSSYHCVSGVYESTNGKPMSLWTWTDGSRNQLYKEDFWLDQYTSLGGNSSWAYPIGVTLTSGKDINLTIHLLRPNIASGVTRYTNTPHKVYRFEAFDSNNNLISYMVPAKRNSDNKLGMYDLMTSTFHPVTVVGSYPIISG